MIKRLTALSLILMATAQTAWSDWEDHFHHRSHGNGSTGDPSLDAFLTGVLLIVAASAVILLIGGPLLILRMRRIRNILLIVPLSNFLLYLLSIMLRSYPGGFTARFRPPGLWYTMGEVLLLLLITLLIMLVLAAIQWVVRKIRPASSSNRRVDDQP